MTKVFKRLQAQREGRVNTPRARGLTFTQRQHVRDGVLLQMLHFVLQDELAKCERNGTPPSPEVEALAEAEAELKTVIG